MRISASSFPFFDQSAASPYVGAQAARCAPAGGEAAGLVSSKTSGPASFLDVGFSPRLVMERRVKRLRRQVWAAGHLQRFRTPNGMRENVWFVTLTYRGAPMATQIPPPMATSNSPT